MRLDAISALKRAASSRISKRALTAPIHARQATVALELLCDGSLGCQLKMLGARIRQPWRLINPCRTISGLSRPSTALPRNVVPPKGWIPTPYVTETVVSYTYIFTAFPSLPQQCRHATNSIGRRLAYMYAILIFDTPSIREQSDVSLTSNTDDIFSRLLKVSMPPPPPSSWNRSFR